MFQDDRMMSILSGVVLMVAIGTVVQKSDALQEWFAGKQAEAVLVADQAEAEPGALVMVDVLANDVGLDQDAAARIVITSRPGCGRVFVQRGALQYLTEESCVGQQVFAYGLRESALAPVEVRVDLWPAGEQPKLASAEAPKAAGGAGAAAPNAGLTLAAGPADTVPEAPRASVAPEPRDSAPVNGGQTSAGTSVAIGAPAALGSEAGFGREPASAAPSVGAPAAPAAPGALAGAPAADSGAPGAAAAADDARPAAAPPLALGEPAETKKATARLPEAVAPSREIAALPVPRASEDAGAHGVDSTAPRGLVLRTDVPAPQSAVPESITLAHAGTRPPEAPRPGMAAEPDAPGAPAADDAAHSPASAPAPIFRPAHGTDALAEATATATAAPAAPERRDSDPLAGDLVGQSDPVRIDAPDRFAAAVPDEELALAAAEGLAPGTEPADHDPASLDDGPMLSFSLAQVEVPEPSAAPAARGAGSGDPAAGASGIERSELPRIGAADEARVALGEPESGLGPVRDLGAPLRLAPIDRAEPPSLDAPKAPSRLPAPPPPAEDAEAPADAGPAETAEAGPAEVVEPTESAAAEAAGAAEKTVAPEADAAGSADAIEIAALPPGDASCAVPPALTIAAGRGAITTVDVIAPCDAGSAVVLEYGGISLGIPLDADGRGAIEVPGFASRMDATVTFADGEELSVTLPFEEIQRVERVALVWDMPVELELHALEFGGDSGSGAHVRPDNGRSFRDVRRSGGGFLQSFAPADGAGQHARVYTYYLRAGGPSGVVRMMVDFASRRAGADGTCGDGALASPGFTVLRTSRGMEERPLRSRLAAAGCGSDAEAAGEMIENAVGNLVIAD